MAETEEISELSANQQAMLDLALACDLRVSDSLQGDTIRARHKAIKKQKDAADYIREVETKINSRRKWRRARRVPAPRGPGQPAPAPAMAPAAPPNAPFAALKAGPGGANVPPPKQVFAPPPPNSTLPRGQSNNTARTTLWTSAALILLLIFIFAVGWYVWPGLAFILVSIMMLLMMVVLGLAVTKNPFGILINAQNLASLSRFQMAIWTLIVLSAYLSCALQRIKMMQDKIPIDGKQITDPLAVAIDWHLWVLMGISTTSLVGTPLILSTKMDKTPDPSATVNAANALNENPDDIDNTKQGVLYANKSMADASLTDMFEGDELANTAQIDLAKVQMFFFTVIAAFCFYVMVYHSLILGGTDLNQLPILPDGLVAILGISHGGFLVSKGVDHTKTVPS